MTWIFFLSIFRFRQMSVHFKIHIWGTLFFASKRWNFWILVQRIEKLQFLWMAELNTGYEAELAMWILYIVFDWTRTFWKLQRDNWFSFIILSKVAMRILEKYRDTSEPFDTELSLRRSNTNPFQYFLFNNTLTSQKMFPCLSWTVSINNALRMQLVAVLQVSLNIENTNTGGFRSS